MEDQLIADCSFIERFYYLERYPATIGILLPLPKALGEILKIGGA